MIDNPDEFFISPHDVIESAMRQLNDTHLKILLVVDENRKLLGTLSDGDIRRGLLAGRGMDATIGPIMNVRPVVGYKDGDLVELRKQMRERSVQFAPLLNGDGCPTAIYPAYYEESSQSSPVLLMVGGEGVRLRPLTLECPKPMLKLGDKPILERILFDLIEQGFRQFYFSVNYLRNQIIDHFGDGTRFGVNIHYVEEHHRMGTAGALRLLDLPPDMTDPLLVLNGDLLTDLSFASMVEHHKLSKAAATTCIVKREQPVAFGVVEHVDGKVLKIREKPTIPIDINAGIYCISAEHIRALTGEESLDMPDFLNSLIEDGETCCTYDMSGFWLDIGSPGDLDNATRIYAKSIVR